MEAFCMAGWILVFLAFGGIIGSIVSWTLVRKWGTRRQLRKPVIIAIGVGVSMVIALLIGCGLSIAAYGW